MSTKPKRNADQAFDQFGGAGSEHATKRQKKHKSKKARRESSGVDDAAAQLLREEKESSSQSQSQQVNDESVAAAIASGSKTKHKKKNKQHGEAVSAPHGAGADELRRRTIKSESPVSVEKESRKQSTPSGEPAMFTDSKVGKNKKRKLEKRQQRLEELHPPQSASSDVDLTPVPVLSKREKSRQKIKAKKQRLSLENRIEDPKNVDPKDVKDDFEAQEDAGLSEDEGDMKVEEGLPLEDRIEAPAKKQKKSKTKSKTRAAEDGWSLTKSVGGTFADQDPILTEDDQYLILPTTSEVRVYSATTSLLVRSLRMHGTVACCTISKTDSARLIVGRNDGKIVIWNWSHGSKIGEWETDRGLRSLTSMSSKGPDNAETVLTSHGSDADGHRLCVYALTGVQQAKHLQTLLTLKSLNSQVQLHEQAGIIVASANSRLIIGQSTGLQSQSYSHPAITWREFAVPGGIISVDARVHSVGSKVPRNRLDLAVGVKTGAIHLYEDLLYKLIAKEKGKQDDDIAFRSLNWHRTAVNAVKWSQDGNYVISGGNETVLVIWQLDTNKQQFLPHLSTEINRLSISKRGSSYALLLGDNSVMVLSTADLNPSANIPSLGARAVGGVVAAMHPTKQGQLLVTIPRSVAPVKADQATGLQTYDIQSDLQIARQALTRNLTTTINIGPEGQLLKEPNVNQLKISFDGAWLATVEEWKSPSSSSEALHLRDDAAKQQTTETTLKFWTAAEKDSEWALTNRVDSPYGSQSVLALASCPTRPEFATVSSDGLVQTWVPRVRRRDGVLVKGSRGQALYNWHVSRKIPLNTTNAARAGTLAYAEDGSVVAASLSTSDRSPQWTSLIPLVTNVVDPSSINHVSALQPRDATFLASAFVGPNLLTLSPSTFSVYDTINAHPLRTITLGGDLDLTARGTHHDGQARHHLAANPLDGTFALALNPGQVFLPSRVLVLSLRKRSILPRSAHNDASTWASSPIIFDATFSSHTTALLPRPSAPGYVLVDANASVREIRGPGASSHSTNPTTGTHANQDLLRGLDALFGTAPRPIPAEEPRKEGAVDGMNIDDDDGRADMADAVELSSTRQTQTLEEVLGWQSSAAVPSVRDVFERVVGLFRKPQQSHGRLGEKAAAAVVKR